MSRINRRDMLGVSFSGAAALTLPSFLASSPSLAHAALLDVGPDDPFFTWFGIDEAMIAKVMAEMMAGGADFADVYFQHSRSNSVRLEDGLVSSASTGIDQGVGLRVVVGDQVGYAFTEDLTLESMLGAARTAAAIAKGSNKAIAPQRFSLGDALLLSGQCALGQSWDRRQVAVVAARRILDARVGSSGQENRRELVGFRRVGADRG